MIQHTGNKVQFTKVYCKKLEKAPLLSATHNARVIAGGLDIAITCWCNMTICQCYNVPDTCRHNNCALLFLVSGFSRCCQRRWRSSRTNKKTSVFNFWSYIRLPLCIPLRVGAEDGSVVRGYSHTPLEQPNVHSIVFIWLHLGVRLKEQGLLYLNTSTTFQIYILGQFSLRK